MRDSGHASAIGAEGAELLLSALRGAELQADL